MSIVNVNLNHYPQKFFKYRGKVYEHYNGYTQEKILKSIKLGIYEKIFPVAHKLQYPISDVLSHFNSNNTNLFAYHIFVAPRIFTEILTDTDVFEIPNDVLELFYKDKLLLILDSFIEHTSIKKDDTFYKVLQNTIKKYKLKTENICSVVNTFNTESFLNIKTITRNIPLCTEPMYELDTEKIQENINTIHTAVHRPFKCMALIRKPRRKRSQFAEFVYQNNLLQENIISVNATKDEVDQFNYDNNYKFKETLPWQNTVEQFKSDVVTPKDLLKFFMDYQLYNKAYCEFLFETEMDSPHGEVFFSEKLNKPLKYLYPFVFIGEPNSLEVLHNMGFKTFGKWWDESYDKIQFSDYRMEHINNLFKELSGWSHDKWCNILVEMKDILLHNHNLYFKIHNDHSCYSELSTYVDTFVAKNDK